MLFALSAWLDRKQVVDHGELCATFGYGVVVGIVLAILIAAWPYSP